MNIKEYDIDHRYEAIVRESVRITPEQSDAEVRHIVLDLPKNTPQYSEGQSIGVLVEGPHEFGNLHHMRLYSVASARDGDDGRGTTVSICVRRCFYIDDVSGERYPGVASNYICDRRPGDAIILTGPYSGPFAMPRDPDCNLLMIGVGTGIAPFRAFMKHVYAENRTWNGQVRLFYGARNGMELLYMNDENNDLGLYYDQETFQAFQALSPRPAVDAPAAVDEVLEEHAEEVWSMVRDPKTHVFVSGQEKLSEQLDTVLSRAAGGEEAWKEEKQALVADDRWSELYF